MTTRRIDRDLLEMAEIQRAHPEWLAYFQEHGKLHPDEAAAIRAQVHREQERSGRNAARRLARRIAKMHREDRERMEAAVALVAKLEAEEPALAERDAVYREIAAIQKAARRWASAHAMTLVHVIGRDAPMTCTCLPRARCWSCAAADLRARQSAALDRASAFTTTEIEAAYGRVAARLKTLRESPTDGES